MAKSVSKRKKQLKKDQIRDLYRFKKSVGERVTYKTIRKKYRGKKITSAAFRVHDASGKFISKERSEAVEYIIRQKRQKGEKVNKREIIKKTKDQRVLVTVPGITRPFHTDLSKSARVLVEQNPSIIFSIRSGNKTKSFHMDKPQQNALAFQEINDSMNDIYRVYNDVKVDIEGLSPLFQIKAQQQYEMGDKDRKIVYYHIDFDQVKHDVQGTANKELFNKYSKKRRYRR